MKILYVHRNKQISVFECTLYNFVICVSIVYPLSAKYENINGMSSLTIYRLVAGSNRAYLHGFLFSPCSKMERSCVLICFTMVANAPSGIRFSVSTSRYSLFVRIGSKFKEISIFILFIYKEIARYIHGEEWIIGVFVQR